MSHEEKALSEFRVRFQFPWGTKGFYLKWSLLAAKREAEHQLERGADVEVVCRVPGQPGWTRVRAETAREWRQRVNRGLDRVTKV